MANELETLDRDHRQDLALSAVGQASGVPAQALVARRVAEVQAAMIIARQFPRDVIAARERILDAFSRPQLAEVAQYEYVKGGTEIRGASIRAMEAIAQLWGHIHMGDEELDRRAGWTTIRVFAFDGCTGSNSEKTIQVEHLRYTKKGTYKLEDPREIYEHGANMAARRLRKCLETIIPRDVIEAALDQADITLHTKAEVTPARLAALVERFAEFGVTREQIEARIQRRIDTMSPAQLVRLGKVYNSLKEGMSSVPDWFEVAPAAAAPERPPAPTRGAAGLKAAAAAKSRQRAAEPPPSANEEELPPLTYAQARETIEAAKDMDVEAWGHAVLALKRVGDQVQRNELYALADHYAHQRADRAAKAEE
jgi:hypothetical protein